MAFLPNMMFLPCASRQHPQLLRPLPVVYFLYFVAFFRTRHSCRAISASILDEFAAASPPNITFSARTLTGSPPATRLSPMYCAFFPNAMFLVVRFPPTFLAGSPSASRLSPIHCGMLAERDILAVRFPSAPLAARAVRLSLGAGGAKIPAYSFPKSRGLMV